MRLTRTLLSTCAALWLVMPAAALAQPPSGQGQGVDQPHSARQGGGGRGSQAGGTVTGQGAAAGASGQTTGAGGTAGQPAGAVTATGQPGGATGVTGRQGGGAGTGGSAHTLQRHAPAATHPVPQTGVTGGGAAGAGGGGGGAAGGGALTPGHRHGSMVPLTPSLPTAVPPSHAPRFDRSRERATPSHLPPLGGWDRLARGTQRDRAGQQWREQHHGWDRASPWRNNPDWWRRDWAFRFYYGPRIGFFFIPDLGYVAAPAEYQVHFWRAGDYLPNWFWRFVVRNYAAYGLPPPPDGCAWVWVDDDVALIDLDDGYVLDIVHAVW